VVKKIKTAQQKLKARISGKLFKYTFMFSVTLHLGIWGLLGNPFGGSGGQLVAQQFFRHFDPIIPVNYNRLPEPTSITNPVPKHGPPGIKGHSEMGENPIPVPDNETENTGYTDRDPSKITKVGPGTSIIVNPEPGIDKPTSASPNVIEFVPTSEPPRILKQVRPEYPDIARSSGIEGDVVLMVYIDESGRVRNAVVQSSPGLPALDEAAIKAAYGCKFKPAEQQGVPVGVWYSLVMQFEL
jgi:protein TonB